MPFTINEAPSPNHSDRQGTPISLIVLHYTGMETGHEAFDRLRDKDAGVSSHYFIDEAGRVSQLVPDDRRAHHAGLGFWAGIHDVNSASIGIELVNPGHYWGYRAFPNAQIEPLMELIRELMDRHHVSKLGVIGHGDLAPDRKEDPGELFPWDRLAEEGLAMPQWRADHDPPAPDYEDTIAMLAQIGYGVRPSHPIAAVLAFQRRFAPQLLGNGMSPETRQAIRWVHGQVMKEKLG